MVTDWDINQILNGSSKPTVPLAYIEAVDFNPDTYFASHEQVRHKCEHEAGHAILDYVFGAGIDRIELDLRSENAEAQVYTRLDISKLPANRLIAVLGAGEAAEIAIDPENTIREHAAAWKGYRGDFEMFKKAMAWIDQSLLTRQTWSSRFVSLSEEEKWADYRRFIKELAVVIASYPDMLRMIKALATAICDAPDHGGFKTLGGQDAEDILVAIGATVA